MKKIVIAIMACMFVLSLTGVVTAAEKIGFIDLRELMYGSDKGKKAVEEFKKIVEKNKLAIQGSEAELQKMKEEIEKQRAVLTEAAIKEKEATYQKKVADFNVLVREAREEMQKKDQELSKSMIPDIQKVVVSIGEKEKYTAIFDISTTAVPFFNKSADITKIVMDKLNRAEQPNKADKPRSKK